MPLPPVEFLVPGSTKVPLKVGPDDTYPSPPPSKIQHKLIAGRWHGSFRGLVELASNFCPMSKVQTQNNELPIKKQRGSLLGASSINFEIQLVSAKVEADSDIQANPGLVYIA